LTKTDLLECAQGIWLKESDDRERWHEIVEACDGVNLSPIIKCNK